jgi:predicted  nucleic acid-binding Zn-ribbon protein
MSLAAQLFRLEQIDSDLDRRESAITELERLQQSSPEVQSAETRLSRLREEAAAAGAEQRRLERDLSELEARIARDSRRMYGGQIVDPRELASLERESALHRAQKDTVEGATLEAMEKLDGLQTQVQVQAQETEGMRRRWEEGQPDRQRQHDQLSADVAGLRAEREALIAEIDPRSLTMYQRLRTHSGHAISVVVNGVCQWCRVTIPPKDLQHARSSLVLCTNCGRILYLEP